jgi:hypothetical protein
MKIIIIYLSDAPSWHRLHLPFNKRKHSPRYPVSPPTINQSDPPVPLRLKNHREIRIGAAQAVSFIQFNLFLFF